MTDIAKLKEEIAYRKKEMKVCAVSKRDIYELEELEEELRILENKADELD